MFRYVGPSSMQNDFVYNYALRMYAAKFRKYYELTAGQGMDSGFGGLWLEQVTADDALWQEMAHPVFLYWMDQLWPAALESGEPERILQAMRQGGRLFCLPLFRRGLLPGEITLQLDDSGTLQFPGHPLCIAAGEEHRDHLIRLQAAEAGLQVRLDSSETSIPWAELWGEAPAMHPYLRSREVLTTGPVEWSTSDPVLREFLRDRFPALFEGYTDNKLAAHEPFTLADRWYYEKAMTTIETYWPQMHQEVCAHIRQVCIIETEQIGGYTLSCIQGAVFLSHRPEDLHWTIENLIHECGHARLNLLFELDPLLLNAREGRYHSPWRTDLRPLEGVLHGSYVFVRVAEWYRILRERTGAPEVQARLAVVLRELGEGLEVLAEHGEFTDLGRALFEEMQEVYRSHQRVTT